jgi:hypothetical protein|nr:MAG TPA: hypothetical protein [Ackermannviridae sp.]
MKLKTPYKTVMFYGNVLRINANANWIAVDENGDMKAFRDEPFIDGYNGYKGWDSASEAIWRLESRIELEGDEWTDTCTYCPQDQQWMIAAVGKLDAAHSIQDDFVSHNAMTSIIKDVAEIIRCKSVSCSVRDTFNALMKHATPSYLRASPVRDLLHDNLFHKSKEPEHRVIKDYYGSDIIVPSWTTYVAMNRNGAVMAFDMQPDISAGFFWGYGMQEKRGQMAQVAWRDETTSDANWQDSLKKV